MERHIHNVIRLNSEGQNQHMRMQHFKLATSRSMDAGSKCDNIFGNPFNRHRRRRRRRMTKVCLPVHEIGAFFPHFALD